MTKIYNVLGRVIGLRLFVINSRLLDPDAKVEEQPVDHQVRRMTVEDHPRVVSNEALGISQSFLHAALDRGDVCIGYFVSGELVSYFWCGFSQVPANPDLLVQVPRGYSYAYKAMTLASYRGQHLQEVLTRANDKLLVRDGFSHNIEYIEVVNFPQRRASIRYGNRTIGWAGFFQNGNRRWIFHTPGVKAIGFAFLEEPSDHADQ